jgi:hypothetical protein
MKGPTETKEFNAIDSVKDVKDRVRPVLQHINLKDNEQVGRFCEVVG